MKVLITGATGLIGRELGKALARKGHELFVVTRDQKKANLELPFPCHKIEANLNLGPVQDQRLSQIEAVIHLAGENVGGGRWTERRKKKIYDSRTQLTENLLASFRESRQLKVLITASGIGIYGDRADEVLSEASPIANPREHFLAEVSEAWEASAFRARSFFPQIRVVALRTAMVLSPFGGAFRKMITPFRAGLGGVLGSGKQWMSWIHIQDVVALYCEVLENPKWEGVFNAASPHPVTNRDFSQMLAQALEKKMGPSVPAVALKVVLGEMSDLVLQSQRVSSALLESRGFQFEFTDLGLALSDCCQYYKNGDLIFYAEQFVDKRRPEVFPFFSKAENLEQLTPPTLQFHITHKSTEHIEKGTEIKYRLKIHGLPVGWTTLIQDWTPMESFVDVQLKGPYAKWEHRHEFHDLAGGTLMTDLVRYRLPMGLVGWALAGKFVEGDVKNIFNFRRVAVPKLLERMS